MFITPTIVKAENKSDIYTLHEDKIEEIKTYVESNTQKVGQGPESWRSTTLTARAESFGAWTQNMEPREKKEKGKEVKVEAETGTIFNTDISTFQSNIVIKDGKATGTLTKLSTGDIAQYWGAGYFIALKFSEIDEEATKVMAGMDPSQSGGLVPLDEDKDGVWKITNKDTQVFKVVQYKDEEVISTQTIDLSGLTLAE